MKLRKLLAGLGVTIVASVGVVALTASPASAATYGPYTLLHSSGYCVESPTPYLGEQLILNYCGGPASHNQHFMFEDADAAWHYFIHLENSPYCLVPGNADLFNSTVILWVCDRSSSKFIWILGFPNGNWYDRDLANLYNARCIDTSVVPTAGEYLRTTGCLRGWYNLYAAS
jgi:hypothetical protein